MIMSLADLRDTPGAPNFMGFSEILTKYFVAIGRMDDPPPPHTHAPHVTATESHYLESVPDPIGIQ